MLSPLSRTSQAILELLSAQHEMYGLEMVKKNSTLKRGTIYVTLSRLEDQGLVSSREEKQQEGRGPARRLYQITGAGSEVLGASREYHSRIVGLLENGELA
jgi:PadR family transcriptional regulator PadR